MSYSAGGEGLFLAHPLTLSSQIVRFIAWPFSAKPVRTLSMTGPRTRLSVVSA
jgi:hypothetical protein